MIRIPPESRWFQANSSDLFGSLSATKNINLDEEGYIKLSSRSVSIMSRDTGAPNGDSDVGLPHSFGRNGEGDFLVVTSDEPLEISITSSTITAAEDADDAGDNPTYSSNSYGAWFQNRWYTTEDADLVYKTGSAWTDLTLSPALTASEPHPLEVFRSRNTLCIGNGNIVQQYDTSHAASVHLTLPTDFTVVGLAYSGARMGVITELDSSISGQNQDAFFFVWDGASTSADTGIPIGSDRAAGIVAYQGTWVIITRSGNLLMYTGGGFKTIGSFPFYFRNVVWGDLSNDLSRGLNMVVEGDVILINISFEMDQYGKRLESTLPYCPSGVWCWDPKVGLYHRYSYSISNASSITATDSNINTSTNEITKTTGTIPPTGAVMRLVGTLTIGGLQNRTDYYCIKVSSTVFKLAETYEKALAGIAIDLTSVASGTHNFVAFDLIDYGATKTDAISGGIALFGTQNMIYDHAIFGSDLDDYDSTSGFKHVNITTPNLENRGYFITAKVPASGTEGSYERMIVPFRPLKTGDVVKIKVKDMELSGLPVSTDQGGIKCAWLGDSEFSFVGDLSDVKTAFDAGKEIDCEIIGGAGAGAIAKVSAISYQSSTGTYAVSLDEAVLGAASGRYCTAVFDNWRLVKTVDSTSLDNVNGYAEVVLSTPSKWNIYKIELQGVETTVEPLLLIEKPRK